MFVQQMLHYHTTYTYSSREIYEICIPQFCSLLSGYLEIDLLINYKLSGFDIQGNKNNAQWTTQLYFLYSTDNVNWYKAKRNGNVVRP